MLTCFERPLGAPTVGVVPVLLAPILKARRILNSSSVGRIEHLGVCDSIRSVRSVDLWPIGHDVVIGRQNYLLWSISLPSSRLGAVVAVLLGEIGLGFLGRIENYPFGTV